MSPNILVTGGAGFIGSHLVDALVLEGYDVSVLDNLSTGSANNINKSSIHYNFSIRDKEKVVNLLKDKEFNYIFHLAAQPTVVSTLKKSIQEFQTTVSGIENLLDRRVNLNLKKFIYFSSAATYSQDAELPVIEEESLNPISYYGLSKLTGEFLVKLFAEIGQKSWVIFRPANVYGPRQRINGEGGVVASFIGNFLKKQNIKIFGNGKKTRDFIYVEDIVAACLLVIKKDLSGIFNLGTTKETSIIDLANNLQRITDMKAQINFLKNRNGEIENSSLNSQKIRQIGWSPETSLQQGLKVTWEHFRGL